jgi:hypothetical protein
MNDLLKTMLLKEHSKANTLGIIHYIGNDAILFKDLIDFLCCDEYRLSQRAAWPLSYIIENQPNFLIPYFETLLNLLADKQKHAAVRRNITRLFQGIDIPEDFKIIAINNCFDLLCDINEPIAVKAFSMTVLERVTRGIPELREELKLVIESQLEFGSKGFCNRGKEILKMLKVRN